MKDPHDMVKLQLSSRPVANQAVERKPTGDGGVLLSLPLEVPSWMRTLRMILPMGDTRRVELDELGRQLFEQCDGTHTLEELVDEFAGTWKLSFFEARGLIIQQLRPLIRYNMLVVAIEEHL